MYCTSISLRTFECVVISVSILITDKLNIWKHIQVRSVSVLIKTFKRFKAFMRFLQTKGLSKGQFHRNLITI